MIQVVTTVNIETVPLHITEWQRGNLKKLGVLLETVVPPPEFDMSNYASVNGGRMLPSDTVPMNTKFYTDCGTTACAAGHGPLAGIKPKPHENWEEYTRRVFGAYHSRDDGPKELWHFLFAPEWEDIDNTPKGAAARIRLVLEHDAVPCTDEIDRMLDGGVLPYKVPEAA